MEIFQITKKEYDKIRHDQEWGIHDCLLFKFESKYYKCTKTGGAGLKAIARFQKARRDIKRDQLNLLGM
jgi:hypothetical protein